MNYIKIARTSSIVRSLARELRKNNLIYDQTVNAVIAHDSDLGWFEMLSLHDIVGDHALMLIHETYRDFDLSDYMSAKDATRLRSLFEEIYETSITKIFAADNQIELLEFKDSLLEQIELKDEIDRFLEEVLD